MAKVSKRLKALRSSVEANKLYAIDEAIALQNLRSIAIFMSLPCFVPPPEALCEGEATLLTISSHYLILKKIAFSTNSC